MSVAGMRREFLTERIPYCRECVHYEPGEAIKNQQHGTCGRCGMGTFGHDDACDQYVKDKK